MHYNRIPHNCAYTFKNDGWLENVYDLCDHIIMYTKVSLNSKYIVVPNFLYRKTNMQNSFHIFPYIYIIYVVVGVVVQYGIAKLSNPPKWK